MPTHDPKLRAWVEINLAALERNLRNIRAALPPWIRYVAVVKADAYGHGSVHTVNRLMFAGADAFAVANLHEAAEIRETGGGWPILVLSAILPAETEDVLEYNVIPAVSTIEEVERLAETAAKHSRRITIHLKIDTGMGRLGVWHTQAAALYQRIRECPTLSLGGVFTHFSSSDSDVDYTAHQRELFLKTIRTLPHLPLGDPHFLVHADNSAGLETLSQNGPFNAVRVGLLQFGVRPYAGSLLDKVEVSPVLSFHSRIGLIKELPAGTSISYNRTHHLHRPSRIAVITAGYGDGIPTSVSNKARVLIRGQRCPILGRVTMDQTVVDVTDLPAAAVGDLVTLIGSQQHERIDVREFSTCAGQIPWEVFVSISKRVQRRYLTDTAL
ncbi:MAG: alanine racemase [Verrucomicrobiota bacterium]|nr:alanine racemase [Verrucomicrobiota bacterium]